MIEDLEKTLYLFNLSDIHKKCTISDIQRLVIPPMKLGQYRIYEDENIPLCYLSWAFLNAETVEDYINNKKLLQADEWNNGKSLWLINIICPFGGTTESLRRLDEDRKKILKGQKILGDGGGINNNKDFSTMFYRRMTKEKNGKKMFRYTKFKNIRG